jgi:hypothetical protein
VTGISTGALIAPFAFAGPKYDPILRNTYTRTTDTDIFKKRNFTAALFLDAMATTRPMGHLVGRYVTQELLDDIAAEFAALHHPQFATGPGMGERGPPCADHRQSCGLFAYSDPGHRRPRQDLHDRVARWHRLQSRFHSAGI